MLDSPARSVPAVAATAATPTSCTVSDSDPKISHLVPPVYSEAIRDRHHTGVVDVSVYLTAEGSISKAVVSRSANDDLLDAATLTAALATTYEPEVKNCTYLAGMYIFRARFKAEPRAGDPAVAPAATEPPPFAPSASPAPTVSPVPQSTPGR